MAVDFPSSPTAGQQYTYAGKTWEWSGSGWILVATSGLNVTIGPTAVDILTASNNEISADDAGADKLVFWDDSAGKLSHLSIGSGLAISGTEITAALSVGDGDKGDITVSSSGATWTIDNGVITDAKVAIDAAISGEKIQSATASAAGSMSGADKVKLDGIETGAQVNVATDIAYDAATREVRSSTGADATLPLVSSTTAGLAPASGGGTTNFLRADGNWSAPPASGGTPSGSSGQLQWNDTGAFAGAAGSTVDSSGNITIGGSLINSANAALSATGIIGVPVAVTGTWIRAGGTGTTTKPTVLIEPTGTTSTAWSTAGTGFGVNAPSGFTGNLLDLQVNGTSCFSINTAGGMGYTTATVPHQLGSTIIGTSTEYGGGQLNSTSNFFALRIGGSAKIVIDKSSTHPYLPSGGIGFASSVFASSIDANLIRDAAYTLAQRGGDNAQTFRVYGAFTSASNFVRAALSSTSTAVTLAVETAGTGADDIPLNLTAAGTGTVKVNSVAEVAASSTVAALPTAPVVGMLTRVSDATSPVIGTTVVGGGSAAALVWYNGVSWSIIGV